ncbi:hypothetical protein BaRGS_00023713 [Batillaria attramentaria]|uniref:Uncharacterized protein n=1 Tax=Batillaria attramentaria TaxID=370345 RepID=A0ABD0KD24_9CAEN
MVYASRFIDHHITIRHFHRQTQACTARTELKGSAKSPDLFWFTALYVIRPTPPDDIVRQNTRKTSKRPLTAFHRGKKKLGDRRMPFTVLLKAV